MVYRPEAVNTRRGTADATVPSVARVRRRWREGPHTWTLELEPEDGELPQFAAGQFNMLTAFGIGEAAISVSGDPGSKGTLVHTVRAVGPVSTALATLQSGDYVGLRGPFGTGWPMQEAQQRDVVIVSGGLGLAPLRPAIYHLLAERQRYGRVAVLYGSRSPGDILFRRELQRWRGELDMDVKVTVDHAPDDWRGNVGVVTSFIPRTTFDPANSVALVCGPELMMAFTVSALQDAGVRDEAIYISMERNMKCAVGLCGHCQFGTTLVCRDGPVLPFDRVRDMLTIPEI
ncbi:MAG: FAD/NAD(P)-binding protein [Betaproteobacteria bacterium]|nr:MAG: FAD/NAD(P)-binding protein [Betaproteobacteria bacterium]